MAESSQLGKYELLHPLGEGGFAKVYKARHRELDALRAVKIPHQQDEQAERQLKEAKLQAALNHPNIVQVYDIDRAEGRFFIVMEYVEGLSLRDLLTKKGRFPEAEVVAIGKQVLSALAHAHAHHVAHLDIKPENILLSESDESGRNVKVADFGIARILQSTQANMSKVVGTLAYMAPEQIDGKADFRSDLWAAGVIFYELLTGRTFAAGGSTGEIMRKIVSDPVPAPRLANPGISQPMEELILRLLQKEPAHRFQSASEALGALERLGSRVTDPSATEVVEAPEAGRPRWPQVLYWSVALVLVAAGSLVAYDNRDRIRHLFTADTGARQVQLPPVEPLAAEFDGLSPDVLIGRGNQSLGEGQHTLAYALYTRAAEQTQNPDQQAEATFRRAYVVGQAYNQPDGARLLYDELIRKYPKSAAADDALYYRGLLSLDRGDVEAAVWDFRQVIEKFPEGDRAADARAVAGRAAEELKSENTWAAGNLRRFVGSRLGPSNNLSLISFATAILSPLLWMLVSLAGPSREPRGPSRPILFWIAMGLYVSCISANYWINTARSESQYQKLIELVAGKGS